MRGLARIGLADPAEDFSVARFQLAVLTIITVAEVWAYYIPSFVASRGFVPTLLILSALKLTIVVMFYMHLKYDHRIFRVLFTGPLLIAALTLLALMFLFGHLYIKVM